ncbi:hypothetical protein BH20ACT2_BH20ACT2_21410 [soil metagenome]
MATTRPPLDEHNFIATFTDAETARGAMVELERHGIESGDVTLLTARDHSATGGAARAEDMAVTGDIAVRAGLGGAIGAVLGALVLVAIVNLAGIEPRAAASIGGALGGAFAGFFLGGYWGGAQKLPVNDDVWDTYLPDQPDHVKVAVHLGDPEQAATAAKVLDDLTPERIERLDRGGRPVT